MAGIRLNLPEQFDFSKLDKWPKWKKCFEQHRSASGRDFFLGGGGGGGLGMRLKHTTVVQSGTFESK